MLGTGDPLNTIGWVEIKPHCIISGIEFTVGIGLTVISKLTGIPVHELELGITVKRAVTGIFDTVVAVNAGILPIPEEAPIPMELLLVVHWYCVPLMADPLKLTGKVKVLAHRIWLSIGVMNGVGLIVIVKLIGKPLQLLEKGVTVICAVIGMLKLLVAENAAILPTPLAGKPIPVLLFVHLYSVPGTMEPLKLIPSIV